MLGTVLRGNMISDRRLLAGVMAVAAWSAAVDAYGAERADDWIAGVRPSPLSLVDGVVVAVRVPAAFD